MPRRKERSVLETVAEELGVVDLRMRIASDFADEASMLETSLVELTNCREVLDNQIQQLKDYIKSKRRAPKRASKHK